MDFRGPNNKIINKLFGWKSGTKDKKPGFAMGSMVQLS